MKLTSIFIFLFLFEGNMPTLNKKVVEFVDKVIGKQVDRGECWDLAAAALDHAGAYLDRSKRENLYIFGKELDPKTDEIFAGDIIQIENVKLEYTRGNAIYTETMSHHTAIVYEVIKKNFFKIAHQNTSFSGRKVGISEFDFTNVKKGKIIFYRPYKR